MPSPCSWAVSSSQVCLVGIPLPTLLWEFLLGWQWPHAGRHPAKVWMDGWLVDWQKKRFCKSQVAGEKVWLCSGWRGQAGLREKVQGKEFAKRGLGRFVRGPMCSRKPIENLFWRSQGGGGWWVWHFGRSLWLARSRHSLSTLCVFWGGCSHLEDKESCADGMPQCCGRLKRQICRVCRAKVAPRCFVLEVTRMADLVILQ